MSEKLTEPRKQPRYDVVYDVRYTSHEESEATRDRANKAETHPAPARVRMRRLRDGSFRVWVRLPVPEPKAKKGGGP